MEQQLLSKAGKSKKLTAFLQAINQSSDPQLREAYAEFTAWAEQWDFQMDTLNRQNLEPEVLPGDHLILCGYPGLIGTSLLSLLQEDLLGDHFSTGFTRQCQELRFHNFWNPLELIESLSDQPIHAWLPLSDGGLYQQLFHLAKTHHHGFQIYLHRVPLKQETIEVCELYDQNPYQFYSGGCVLLVAPQSRRILSALNSIGIPAREIGSICAHHDMIISCQGEQSLLNRPKEDGLLTILKEGLLSL